jgi:catechol-2,3-dioxygenase
MTDQTSSAGIPAPDFRLPTATRLGLVRLQIADLPRSLDYYERVLGFRVLERSAGLATLGTADGTPLVQLQARAGAHPAPSQGRLGLYHYAILLPDRPALGRFITHLSQLGERAGASDHLVSEALYLRDPDGLGIEVYVDRPRSSWGRQGQEIAMDTCARPTASLGPACRTEPGWGTCICMSATFRRRRTSTIWPWGSTGWSGAIRAPSFSRPGGITTISG